MVNESESYPSDTHFRRGEKLVEQSKYKEAIEEFKKSIKEIPDPYNGYAIIGSLLALMGSFEESLKWFDEALARKPNAADLWYNKALSLRKISRFVEAEQAVINCLALDPEHFAALTLKGILRSISGEAEEALKLLDKALEINPLYELSRKNKATILNSRGNLQELKKAKDKALKDKYGIETITIPAWDNQGLDFLKFGTIEELTPDVTYERVIFILGLYNLSPDSVYIFPTIEYNVLVAIERTPGAFALFQKKYNIKTIQLNTQSLKIQPQDRKIDEFIILELSEILTQLTYSLENEEAYELFLLVKNLYDAVGYYTYDKLVSKDVWAWSLRITLRLQQLTSLNDDSGIVDRVKNTIQQLQGYLDKVHGHKNLMVIPEWPKSYVEKDKIEQALKKITWRFGCCLAINLRAGSNRSNALIQFLFDFWDHLNKGLYSPLGSSLLKEKITYFDNEFGRISNDLNPVEYPLDIIKNEFIFTIGKVKEILSSTSGTTPKFCTKCGNALKEDHKFCTQCGNKVG